MILHLSFVLMAMMYHVIYLCTDFLNYLSCPMPLIFTPALAQFLIHKMSTLATVRQLIKDITSLSTSLSDSVPQGSTDDKIYRVMNTEEHDTPHETFN